MTNNIYDFKNEIKIYNDLIQEIEELKYGNEVLEDDKKLSDYFIFPSLRYK